MVNTSQNREKFGTIVEMCIGIREIHLEMEIVEISLEIIEISLEPIQPMDNEINFTIGASKKS